jgi:cytochrome b pre-mRNA-processing protein 3
MIFGYFGRKRKNREIVDGLYRQLTAAARDPVYYSQMNVPDTVMGRFEMLSLLMVLFFRRTDKAGPAVKQLAQDMVDTFFEDIDHSIRELGIGDVSVPKRMKKLARMFYGRAHSYGEALSRNDADALADALVRNIHPERKTTGDEEQRWDSADMQALAGAIIALERVFEDLREIDLLNGRLDVVPVESPNSAGRP